METVGLIANYVYAGLFVTDSEWIHPERVEETYEIICVVAGAVHLEEDGVPYTLGKGDVMILRPGVMHRGLAVSTGRTSFYWVHFTAEDFSALRISQNVIHGFTNVALLKQFLHVVNTQGYPDYAADAVLAHLLAEMACFITQGSGTDKRQVVYDAAEWIRIHAASGLTAAEVAQKYGYNSEHFARLFKKTYGMGLKEYIYEERMKAARNLLSCSEFSVKQIAAMLSFDNVNQFVNYFKYHQGISPAKFRNSLYNVHMNRI